MDSHQPEAWVAYRMELLSAKRNGRLAPNSRLVNRIVRVVLFLDLILRSHVWFDDRGGNVDTTSVQFLPADALLRWVQTNLSKPVVAAFERASVTAGGVARAARDPVTRRRSLRRRPPLDRETVELEYDHLNVAAATALIESPSTATVVALAAALGWVVVDTRAQVYAMRLGIGGHQKLLKLPQQVMDNLAPISIKPNTAGGT